MFGSSRRKGGLANGSRVTLALRKGPVGMRWLLEHRDVDEPRQFADEQISGPFKSWRHLHRFEPDEQGGCIVRDHIEYALPAGNVGESLAGNSIDNILARLFRYRHKQLRHELARHAVAAGMPPQRIVVSGSSGLIGSALCNYLTTGGHRVDHLVRKLPRPGSSDIRWKPSAGEIDSSGLEGADIVVHLAGENLAGRWTPARKEAIRNSRVTGTSLLCQALAGLQRKPNVIVSASAVGYYGDRAAEILNEDSSGGDNFLAEVCKAWEAAAEPARQAGIRVVHPRFGIVLSGRGGALRAMLTPFKLGLGGSIGSGYQYISWIDIDDLLAIIEHAMFTDEIAGPINAVSPNPVTQRDFAAALGKILHRPAVLNMPGPLLRLLLGDMADNALLSSQCALPDRLVKAGFRLLLAAPRRLACQTARPRKDDLVGIRNEHERPFATAAAMPGEHFACLPLLPTWPSAPAVSASGG